MIQDLFLGSKIQSLRNHLGGQESLYKGKYAEGFYTNTNRGSATEQLARVLQKNYPETGVVVKEEARDSYGRPLPSYVSIWIQLEKKAKVAPRLWKMLKHPVRDVLDMNAASGKDNELVGRSLEERGEIPAGTTNRALARYYRKEISELEELFPNDPYWESRIEDYKQKLNSLGVEPLTDKEVQEILLEKVVKPEFGSPKQTMQ